MIEINISIKTAVDLVVERMKYELRMRIRQNELPEDSTLESIDREYFYRILDCAIFDIAALLPGNILTEESNLNDIITKAVHSIAQRFNYPNLEYFSKNDAERLLLPIKKIIIQNKDSELFRSN